jgi:hypothetical protein
LRSVRRSPFRGAGRLGRGLAALPLAGLLLGLAPPEALAVPVFRSVEATLDVRVIDIPSAEVPGIPISGVGTVSVDPDVGRIVVPAGLAYLSAPVVIPVTSTTALGSLSATTLSNQSGAFSLGGGGLPGESCPPAAGEACVGGSRLGGAMGLTGQFYPFIIPNIVRIPIDVAAARIGQGGSVSSPFTYDAAPWTLGTARVRTASGTFTASGSIDTAVSSLTFVTPLYVNALGNVMPTFSRFTLRFTDGLGLPDFVSGSIPEPGTGVLLGGVGVVVGVFALGRRIRRSR